MSETILRQSPSVIVGIGSANAERLRAVGIPDMATLLQSRAQDIQRKLGDVALQEVKDWLSAAWLLQVDGVTPAIADAFVADGIDSIQELGRFGLRTLELAVRRAHKAGKLDEEPSLYNLAGMQREAGQLIGTAPFIGRVLHKETDEPFQNVHIRFGGKSTTTDKNGMFYLIGVPAGEPRLILESGYQRLLSASEPVRAGQLEPTVTYRVTTPDAQSLREVREIDGALISSTPTTEIRFITRKLDELPPATYLRVLSVGKTEKGRAGLLHLYRTRIGFNILVDQVYVEKADLPQGAEVGTVLRWESGQLTATDLTLQDVAKMKFEAAFGPILKFSAEGRVSTSSAMARGLSSPDMTPQSTGGSPIPIYFFFGQDGCAECQCETGYKVGGFAKPHPHCNCWLVKVEDIQPGEFELVYKNVSVENLISLHSIQHTVENCDHSSDIMQMSVMPSMREEWWDDEMLQEVAESFGFEEEDVSNTTASIIVPANRIVSYEDTIEVDAPVIEAELWMVANLNGEPVEKYLETHMGWVRKNVNIYVVEAASVPCETE